MPSPFGFLARQAIGCRLITILSYRAVLCWRANFSILDELNLSFTSRSLTHSLTVTMSDTPMTPTDSIAIEWPVLPQRPEWKTDDTSALPTPARPRPSAVHEVLPSTTHEYEYLDHTADIQIHAWDKDLNGTFASCAVAMFGYMCQLNEISTDLEVEITASGHDLHSLLYNFLDECLYIFHTDSFAMVNIVIGELNTTNYSLSAIARGGTFDASRHTQGTEVKAITYSNMNVRETDTRCDVHVIVDI